MVTIIVNELKNKDDIESSELVNGIERINNRDYEIADNDNINIYNDVILSEIKDIKSLHESYNELVVGVHDEIISSIGGLVKENIELKSEIQELKKTINNMNKSMNKKLINLNKTQLSSEEVENILDKLIDERKNKSMKPNNPKRKKHKRGKSYNDSDPFIPNKHVSTLWNDLTLMNDGSIYNKGHKDYKLPISLNELLYFIECDTPHMNYGEFKRLKETYEINAPIMGKLIYNIRKNKFDSILGEYLTNLNKTKFNLNDNDYLQINKTVTNIPCNLARDWIKIIINSNKKQEKILEIQRANPDIDNYYIRVICDSYNNNKLLKLLKEEPLEPFIENNPSKREDLIRQGGLI